jgi:protein tyrosine phosphatase
MPPLKNGKLHIYMKSSCNRVLDGEICIGHRPKLKHIPKLKKEGFTHIVTILSEKECANKILSAVKTTGMIPLWIELGSAEPVFDEVMLKKIKSAYDEIQNALINNGKVYIHCSAGIHRTGMITNGLLLYLGYSNNEALQIIKSLREITYKEVGEARLQWGRQFQQKST